MQAGGRTDVSTDGHDKTLLELFLDFMKKEKKISMFREINTLVICKTSYNKICCVMQQG